MNDEKSGYMTIIQKITDMNEVEFLATKLGCPDLINANRNQLNSAARQAISYYLKKAGYHERDIAKMQRKSRATIYHHIKTFRELLQVKDPLAIMLWKKLGK